MLFYPVRCVMAYIYYVSLSDVSKSSVVEFSAVISLVLDVHTSQFSVLFSSSHGNWHLMLRSK